MQKGHHWGDLIFRTLRHAWLFDAYDFLLKRTMSSFFNAIKKLLTAYHIDKVINRKNYRAIQCSNLMILTRNK